MGLPFRHPTQDAVSILGLVGCAGLQPPHRDHLESAGSAIHDCARWFEALDSTVTAAGVGDIGARRVAGFPYLRIDRFTASFAEQAATSRAVADAWLERLRALDADGRRIEIANLPGTEVSKLAPADRETILSRTRDCAGQLAQADLPDNRLTEQLLMRARVDDDYSSLKRALGLYGLTSLPFLAGVENWQDDATRTIQDALQGEPPRLPVTRYLPPAARTYTRAQVQAILSRAAAHPLGIAELSEVEQERLFATYAPVFEIETDGDFDRIGQLRWSGEISPRVDVTRPTVYRRLEHTRLGERTLIQLVYTAWLPARPRQHGFDLLGGHLDGVVWRVTLAPDGEPVLFDSIHPCGCYHMFFPTPRVEPIDPPDDNQEWAFVPATLPRIGADDRLVLGLQTRTHYLRNVGTGKPRPGIGYRLVDYDELRSLPRADGSRRSIFAPDGLVPGSERRERFLFWPMGIKSAGAMRQAGTQATAFVGRRHFDDADLIEKRFRLLPSSESN